jgi:hypothetical protein
MAKVNGSLFRLKIGSYLVAATTDCEFSLNMDNPKTTTQDSGGFEESLDGGGIISASGSINGLVDPDANFSAEELLDLILNRTTMPTAQYGVVGGQGYTSKVKLTNVKLNGANQQPVGVSASWVSSGDIVKLTTMTS